MQCHLYWITKPLKQHIDYFVNELRQVLPSEWIFKKQQHHFFRMFKVHLWAIQVRKESRFLKVYLGEVPPLTGTTRGNPSTTHHEVKVIQQGLGLCDAECLIDVGLVRKVPVGPRRILPILRHHMNLQDNLQLIFPCNEPTHVEQLYTLTKKSC